MRCLQASLAAGTGGPLLASRRAQSRLARQQGRSLRLVTASLTGSSEDSSAGATTAAPSTSGPKPSIKQTMADLDALLGIEEEKQEEPQVGRWLEWSRAPLPLLPLPPAAAAAAALWSASLLFHPVHQPPHLSRARLQQQEAKKEEGAGARISIDASVLRQLAEAEAARAEKLGSAASSKEVQTRIADSIERIVEQVGTEPVLASMPGRLSWRLGTPAGQLRRQRACWKRKAAAQQHSVGMWTRLLRLPPAPAELRAAVAAAAGEEAG